MKPLVRLVSVAAVLGMALAVSGCVSQTSRSRARVVEEFAVVESSTTRELTAEQQASLREAVTKYLREQGMSDGRVYFVKVTFPVVEPATEPEWAIVRIGSPAATTYRVLAAYPGRDDYYPYDLYSPRYAGYPTSFSGWGYYNPFDYDYGYYPGRPRHRPGGGDHHHKPGDHDPRDDEKPDKPDDKPAPRPGTWTRWNANPPQGDDQPRGNPPRRTPTPERWDRSRGDRQGGTSSNSRPERSERNYTPRPERAYQPAPERSYSAPVERSYSPPPSSDSGSSRSESNSGNVRESAPELQR